MCLCSAPYPVTCVTRGADLMDAGVVVLCPPDCTQWRVSVFGTGVYASVSSVCGAAVHRYDSCFYLFMQMMICVSYVWINQSR